MFYEPAKGHGLTRDPFKALVGPRPIGWFTTLDRDGKVNLAPYSYFNAVGDDPPTVMFSGNEREAGGAKDSWRNAMETGEFVHNVATWALRNEMNATSEEVEPGRNEADLAGLELVPSRIVKPPRVARSPIQLECRFLDSVRIPQNGGYGNADNMVVLGQVVGIHIADEVLVDGRVDVKKVKPIARLGYAEYAVVDTIFRMVRPGV